jgi:ATP-dependent exoDNAse (exonuclease V) alpha subunit
LQGVDRLIKSDAVVEIRRDPLGEPIYSTPKMIKLERETLDLARDLATRRWPGLDAGQLDRRAIASGLSPEQAIAASVLAQPRCLALLEGNAGSGKTQSLKPLVGQLTAEGYRVIAASTAWRTSEMLTSELGVEARAIDSWLAIARTGGRFLDDKTVLIVDEVGLMGVRATNAILKHAAHLPVRGAPAKIILCGDAAQLKPIAAGAGIELVRIATKSATLETIVRQRDPAMRRAVGYLSRGEVVAGYEKLAAIGCIVETAGNRPTIAAAIDTWSTRRAESPRASHLLLARTNATLRALNTEIRKRLHHEGQLQGSDVAIAASSASGEPFLLKLAAGDRVRFAVRAKLDGQRIINGTSATIEHIEPDSSHHARIVARIGRKRVAFSTKELADENGHARLAHDYAATVYAAQGLTAETCTVVVDPGYDRHSLYVSASRARGNTTLFVDVAAIDAIVIADRPYSTRKDEVTANQRLATLLARLSRSQRKTTTLEAADIAEHTRCSAATHDVPQRRVKKELGHEL